MKISPIISAEQLQNINKEKVVIVNAGGGDAAYQNYLTEHLEGAIYVDLNKDLAEIPEDAKNGGRHPLPSLEKFATLLHRLEIDYDSHVIVYDNQNAANAAARFWWMLRSAGIEKVQVLNGGFPPPKSLSQGEEPAVQADYSKSDNKKAERLSLKKWTLPKVDIEFIEKHSEDPNYLVIDVRDKDRYDGKVEPIDQVAGHIPGAINIPYKYNLNEDGSFKNPETLYQLYAPIFKDTPFTQIAIHCGSGVTACHTLLALDYAGFKIPNLYIGSWSEWSRNNLPIAKNI